jgi:peptidyl-prolyl cis-trans isomerase C
MRRIALIGLAALAATACQPEKSSPAKSGPVVAKGSGFSITAAEFKARVDEQSPFIRARYSTLERKKEFLDNLVRFEVLAREAEKQGLAKDPEVQLTLKKIMVQKLVQKNFQDATGAGANDLPEADLQKYFEEHKADYYRPRKVRVAAVVWNAPAGSPERAAKLATARKALAKLKVEEKKNTLAFSQIVTEFSEDPATKALSGDLSFKSQEELEKGYSKELAQAAFSLKPGETSGVIEAPAALYLAKVTGQQEEMNRTFDQVKMQIANKLYREKKTKEFDEWLKRLRAEAKVTVDDKALESVEISAAAPAGPDGMPRPMMGGMGGMGHGAPGGPQGGPMIRPAAPPAPAPAPATPAVRVPILLATAALAAGCSRCGGGRPTDGRAAPVAVVNGERVEAAAVARELRDAQAGEGGARELPGAPLRRSALDGLIERALLLQEARTRGVSVEPEQVERAFQRLRAEYPGTQLDELLAEQKVSEAELKASLRDQLTIERLFEAQVYPAVQVADAEVARHYKEHAAELDEPERVHALQIVVASREEALAVRAELRRTPKAFAELARARSIAPEGKAGGDLGFIGRGSGFPEVFDVCFTLPLNTISDVISSPYGFHVFKVVEKRKAQRRTLEEARAGIAERLGREKRARAQAEFVEALRRRASIQIDEKALAAVIP